MERGRDLRLAVAVSNSCQKITRVLLKAEITINHMTVKLYTTVSCPYCFTLKEFFKEHNIDFEEVDVTQEGKNREELIKKSGKIEVPVVEIDGEVVVGFDKAKIVQLLNIEE